MRILVLSRSYPNDEQPHLGVWVENMLHALMPDFEFKVVAVVPFCPPLMNRLPYYRKFQRIPRQEIRAGIEVFHPRMLVGPGQVMYSQSWRSYLHAARKQAARIHKQWPFDIVHGHFTYPDGVVAAKLGAIYEVPAVITEHSLWEGWMDRYPAVCRQATWAVQHAGAHIAVSEILKRSMARFLGDSDKSIVIPNGVDVDIFHQLASGYDPDTLLFVGWINYTKGVDVLLRALQLLVQRRPSVRLSLVGGSVYKNTAHQESELRNLAVELGVASNAEFLGIKSPSQVADLMSRSAAVVVPSRRESFGAVIVEALACGTPVVATRCGGPEEILDDSLGVLVAKEDPAELAAGIEYVLDNRENYDSARLSEFASSRFSWRVAAEKTAQTYRELSHSR